MLIVVLQNSGVKINLHRNYWRNCEIAAKDKTTYKTTKDVEKH